MWTRWSGRGCVAAVLWCAVTVAQASTLTFQQGLNSYTGTQDTFVKQSQAASNFGSDAHVDWDGEDGGGQDFGLIRFDGIFGVGASQIAPTDVVTSATLVYIVDNAGNSASVNEVLVDWDPATVTYNNFGGEAGVQPDEYGTLVGDATGTTGTNNFVVTTSISAWATNPSANKGWVFRPTSGNDGVQLHSADSTLTTQRVKLVVVLNEGAPGTKTLVVKHTPYVQLGDAPLANTGPGIGDTDQVVIAWQTVESAGVGAPTDFFEVEYRQAGGGAYIPVTPIDVLDTNTQTRLNHSVTITGLSYDTAYEYRVIHKRNPSTPVTVNTYTGTYTTRLAPLDTQSFSFAAYGDSAYLTDSASMTRFESVMSRITTLDPAFVSLLGDNIYDLGTHTALDARFDPSAAPNQVAFIRNHIDYYCNGNHDSGGVTHGVPSLDNYYCPVPVQGVTSPVATPAGETPEFNYSFDYGLVHFVVMDSTAWGGVQQDDGVVDWVSPTRQAAISQWLEADLQATSLPWTVVCTHHPPIATLDKSDQTTMANTIIPILVNNNVDLLLVGHSHAYQRSYPITGYSNGTQFIQDDSNLYEKGGHVIEVVAGTGGRDIRGGTPSSAAQWLDEYFSDANGGQVGPVIVDVTPSEMHVKFIFASDGSIRDEFRIIVPGPQLSLNVPSFSHTIHLGDSLPNDVFTVTNSGPDTLNYTIADDAGWLSTSPTSGDSTGEADPIDIIYGGVGSLPIGQYVANITVTSPDASNSPKSIIVNLTVETVASDFDGDEDVDMDDFAHLQACFSGSGIPQLAPSCQDTFLDIGDDVDVNDFLKFLDCFSGANVPADKTCDD